MLPQNGVALPTSVKVIETVLQVRFPAQVVPICGKLDIKTNHPVKGSIREWGHVALMPALERWSQKAQEPKTIICDLVTLLLL